MNFRKEGKINMAKLANEIEREYPRDDATTYAPPSVRNGEARDVVVEQVKSFEELVTKEIDDTIQSAKQELAALERDGQVIRDAYVKHTAHLQANIKRLRDGIDLSQRMFAGLREQLTKLDEPSLEQIKVAYKEAKDAVGS